MPSLGGKNILIENTDGEPVGLVWDRYRSLLKSFIIGTGTTCQPNVTEQTGTEVWRKVWQDSKTRGHTHLLHRASFLVLQLDPSRERRYRVTDKRTLCLFVSRQRHRLPRRDGQKVLLIAKNMGGESEAARDHGCTARGC